jgi:hypothetical protein
MGEPKGQKESLAASAQATALSKQQQANQQKLYDQMAPYLQSLTGLGFDVNSFVNSPLGAALLAQQSGGISKEYGAARNLLAENLGSAGLTGSGVGIGPQANLLRGEASAQAGLRQQLPIQGLQLGMQGIQGLSSLYGMNNPTQALSAGIQGYEGVRQGGFWPAFTGALGASLGGIGFGSSSGSQGTTFGGGFGGWGR